MMASYLVNAVLRAVHPDSPIQAEIWQLRATFRAEHHSVAIEQITPYLTIPGEYEITCRLGRPEFPPVKLSVPLSPTRSASS